MSTTPKSLALIVAALLVFPYAAVPLPVFSASSQGFTVTVTDGRQTIHAGGTLIYAITVGLQGNDQKTLDVTFDVPDYATIISPSNGGELRSGKVIWSNLTMSPNTSMTLNVQVTLLPNVKDGTVLTASAIADGVRSTDSTTIGTQSIPQKSFSASITDGRKTISPTQDVTYTATVKNTTGKDEVADVHMSLSHFVTIEDIDPDAYVNNDSITWYNVEFPAGTSKTFVVEGRVDRFAAEYYLMTTKLQVGGTTVSDRTSVQTNIDDLIGNNQEDSSVRFSVTPDASEILPGGRIRYTVSVRNADTQSIDGLKATIKFDPSVSMLVNAGKAEKVNASTIRWNVPKLSAGETWRTTFELALVDGLPLGTLIPLVSTLQGSSIKEITLKNRVSVTSVALIGDMPATGFPMDTFATFALLPFALLATAVQRKVRLV